jgi:hypothetical protein
MQHSNRQKGGNVLVAVMLISFLISIAGSGLIAFSRHRQLDAVRAQNEAKAFWAAEGALQALKSALQTNRLNAPQVINALPNITIDGIPCDFSYQHAPTLSGAVEYDIQSRAVRDQEEVIIEVHAIMPSLARWGLGMATGHSWDIASSNPNINWGNVVISWAGKNRIMGPFYSGTPICIPGNKTSPSLTFGDMLYAPEIFDKSVNKDPFGMKNGNHDDKILSDSYLEQYLPNGYNRKDNIDLISKVQDNHQYLLNNADVTIGGNNPTADTVYEIQFNSNGTYKYRKTKAVMVANATSGLDERPGKNPLALDLNKSGSVNSSFYSSLSSIQGDVQDGAADQDAMVFLDFEFNRDPGSDGDWSTDYSILDGDVIKVNGDALLYGEVNGNLSVVTENNVFIGEEGLTYASLDPDWRDWQVDNSGRDLKYQANNNCINNQDLLDHIKNVDDMIGIVTGHQIIVLADPDSSTDTINLHASMLIAEDVDTDFGNAYDIKLHDDIKQILENAGVNFEDIIDNPEDYLVAENSPAGNGLPDYFYKQYCTTGLHPWDMRTKDDNNSFINIFGGLTQYRHSRFNPGRGFQRKFLFDWRFARMSPAKFQGDNYYFVNWTRIK